MSVNKRLLEEKTNQELEKYIEIGNRFVPEANIYAYEILKSRGREFTEEENSRIVALSNKINEDIPLHQNFKKASHLIYLSALLGIGNLIWNYENYNTSFALVIGIFTIASLFIIGYLIEKGNEVAKYLFIILFILGLISIPSIITNFIIDPILGIINTIQTILQLFAVIRLLKIPKLPKKL